MVETLDLLRRNPVQAAAIAIVLAIVIGVYGRPFTLIKRKLLIYWW
jgi:hypothetical protein